MGMFDTVRCRYPLPHHQDAEFQTKALARLVHQDAWIGGFLDEYEITEDGRLKLHAHEREWRKDPDHRSVPAEGSNLWLSVHEYFVYSYNKV